MSKDSEEAKEEIKQSIKNDVDLSEETLLENDRYTDSNKKIEEKIDAYQKHWNDKLQKLFPMIKDFSKLSEAEVLHLSYRHQVNDTLFTLLSKLSKKTQLKKKIEKELLSNPNIKKLRTKKEKYVYIDSVMSGLERQIELLQIFIDFCRSVIDTIDKVSFTISHRIKYEEMK